MRVALVLCSFAAVAHALIKPVTVPDTKANREEQVDKYFEVMPVEDMLDDMSHRILQGSKAQPQETERFKRAMKLLDTGKIEDTMRKSMLRSLTASEMAFVTEVYNSELGRSVMKKLPVHMADVMPVIDGEFKRVMEIVTPPEELEKFRKQQQQRPQVGAPPNRM